MPLLLNREVEPGIRVLTLNRPNKLNALSKELIDALYRTLDKLADDRSCRVIILTGAGRGFCAGTDLAAFDEYSEQQASGWDARQSFRDQERIAGLVTRLQSLPQVVIAAVNGAAAGGGFALALASDTRICSEGARFNAAFVRLGLSGCDIGVSYLLPRIVSPTLAFEMMVTGRLIDADEALSSGLVLKSVPADELLEAALETARAVVANSPFGVWMTKQVMWANLSAPSLQHAVDLENRTQQLSNLTSEAAEAQRAFVERRPADFGNA